MKVLHLQELNLIKTLSCSDRRKLAWEEGVENFQSEETLESFCGLKVVRAGTRPLEIPTLELL